MPQRRQRRARSRSNNRMYSAGPASAIHERRSPGAGTAGKTPPPDARRGDPPAGNHSAVGTRASLLPTWFSIRSTSGHDSRSRLNASGGQHRVIAKITCGVRTRPEIEDELSVAARWKPDPPFLVHAIRKRIILTRTAEWMGFSHIDYIGEYAMQLATHVPELVGDERADAALMW